ncbi:MAG: holo-ACP synthase [Thermodesulfobacteriota bacterium]
MIVGIGTDIVDNARIESVISRHGERFVKRIFSGREIEHLRKFNYSRQTVGASFAAKEALVKALGTGFRYGISFSDMEIVRDADGKPLMKLSGKADEFARALGTKQVHLSISHEKSHSLAVVILES